MEPGDARRFDALFVDVNVATLATDAPGYGEIRDGAVGVRAGRVAWVGPRRDLRVDVAATIVHEGRGAWLLPGLVDCHTHVVYAGNRSDEFEARLEGATYEDIARRGGGILSTVRATRAASEDALCAASLARVRALMSEGVTTLEIKSGYGLDRDTEAKMLRVARRLGATLPLAVRTTFLGAHALPPEYAGRPDAYINAVCDDVLPALAREGLVDAVDAFCDTIGFTRAQTERVFRAARALGLPVKLHAEQLSNQHGAALAARYGALSADHLEWLDAEGIAAMARAGTVAVLLPGAYYFLRETRRPPIAALREAGVPIAVATDCNPGSSPIASLLTTLNMACTLFRLTPLEALRGATLCAARALGIAGVAGSVEVGKRADFALYDVERPAELAYAVGMHSCRTAVVGGVERGPLPP